MSNEAWAELGDAVSAIRAELQKAADEGNGKPLQFRAGPVELEFTVAVKKEAGGKARIFVAPWASAEANGKYGADTTHRLKLTLQPVDGATGQDSQISSQTPRRPQ